MTERVTIEGRDLTVTADKPATSRRPVPTVATGDGRARSTGRTLEQVMREPNPYWDDNGHRIMQDTDPYDC